MATPPDFSPGQVLTAAHMDAVGLWKIGSVSFSGATQVDFLNVFSSSYETYRIEFDQIESNVADDFAIRFRTSGGIVSTSDYLLARNEVSPIPSNNTFFAGGGYVNALRPTFIESGYSVNGYMDVFRPNLATTTATTSTFVRFGSTVYIVNGGGFFRLTSVFTGFSFVRLGSGTFSGKATVYGYR